MSSSVSRLEQQGPPKELIAGYWIIQVAPREEAIEWAKRIPAEICEIGEVELRPFYELEDFAPGAALVAAKELGKSVPRQQRRTAVASPATTPV